MSNFLSHFGFRSWPKYRCVIVQRGDFRHKTVCAVFGFDLRFFKKYRKPCVSVFLCRQIAIIMQCCMKYRNSLDRSHVTFIQAPTSIWGAVLCWLFLPDSRNNKTSHCLSRHSFLLLSSDEETSNVRHLLIKDYRHTGRRVGSSEASGYFHKVCM